MDFIVLLSVLAITHTIASARPADTRSKTKRSVNDGSDDVIIFNPDLIVFPTELKHGFKVTINGTIDTTNKTFEAVFPTKHDKSKHCRIEYDFKTSMLQFSPVPPGEDGTLEYEIYGNWETPEVYPTFSIILTARRVGKNHMFTLSFDGNGEGVSDVINCPIESFSDFRHVEFRQGLHNVTSLLFEFL